MKKEQIFAYILEKHNSHSESISDKYPDFAVFRHAHNAKWFGVFIPIDASRLNLSEAARAKFKGEVKLLNLKCPPDLAQILADGEHIIPAYHMNKKHWISVNLDSDIKPSVVFDLIDESSRLTKGAK